MLSSANDPRFQELVQGRFVGIPPMNSMATTNSINEISDAMKAVLEKMTN